MHLSTEPVGHCGGYRSESDVAMKIKDALLKNLYEEAEEEGKISREILLENSDRDWDVPHAFCDLFPITTLIFVLLFRT